MAFARSQRPIIAANRVHMLQSPSYTITHVRGAALLPAASLVAAII
ncbi:MAG: hypothetical protein ABI637_01170 [Gemmatimonadota bacterium]